MIYTDNELIELARNNSDKAARYLIQLYTPLLRNICSSNLENSEDINECVNEVFADFFLKLDHYNSKSGSIKSYLCSIAKHKSIDIARKNYRYIQLEKKLSQAEKEKHTPSQSESLDSALEQLSPLDQKILKMHYYDEKSYKEISEELNMNYEQVKKRSFRGKKKLMIILLLGLLTLSIVACTSIVMKEKGLLPTWFPFYEWIPGNPPTEEPNEEQKEEPVLVINTYDTKKKITPQDRIEEEPTDMNIDTNIVPFSPTVQESTTEYYINEQRGVIDGSKPAFTLQKNTQIFEINKIRYEMIDAFYHDGVLSVYFQLTCLDEDLLYKEPPPDYDSEEEMLEWVKKYGNNWADKFNFSLQKSYIITSEKSIIPPIESGVHMWQERGYLPSDNSKFRYSLDFSWSPKIETNSSIACQFAICDDIIFDLVLVKKAPKTYNKSYHILKNYAFDDDIPTDSDRPIHSDYVNLFTGISALSNNMAIIELNQNLTTDYEVTDWITQNPFFFNQGIDTVATLIDTEGNKYERFRVTSNQSTKENIPIKQFQIYFNNIIPGNYKLVLPNLCLRKKDTTDLISVPLPTGESPYIECDIVWEFSDGSKIRITGLERYKTTYIRYEWGDWGAQIIEEHEWRYKPTIELLSGTNDLTLFAASTIVTTPLNQSAFANTSFWREDTNEHAYYFSVQGEKMPDTLNITFYDPIYILDEEFIFDVTLQK